MWYSWCIIFSAALLYAASFIWSPFLWWLTLFSLVPILYEAYKNRISFSKGMFWGSLLILLHSGAIFYSTFLLISASVLLKLAIIGGIVLYIGLHAGIVCFGAQLLSTSKSKYFIWPLALWLFFVWFSSCMFWIFIRCEGYSFSNPLLPLVHYPPLLSYIGTWGVYPTLLLLIAGQASITALILQPSFARAAILGMFTIPWIMSIFHYTSSEKPSWLQHIAWLPRHIPQDVCVSYTIKKLQNYISALKKSDPAITTIVLPEDGVQTTNLTHPLISSLVTPQLSTQPLHILVGAYRNLTYPKYQYNTVFHLQSNKSVEFFDKRHTMIFTEQTPPIIGCNLLSSLDTEKVPFSSGINSRPLFNLLPEFQATPYLCSELFFNNQPDDTHASSPVVALCSEKWAQADYIQRLMFDVAKLRALTWQRDILYVSYHYGALLTGHGQEFPLKNFDTLLKPIDDEHKSQEKHRNEQFDSQAQQNIIDLIYTGTNQLNLGTITQEYHGTLPLTQPYHVIKFQITPPYARQAEILGLVLTNSKHHQKITIQAYFYHENTENLYYLDTVSTDMGTPSINLTITPQALVIVQGPEYGQIISASRYR